MFPASACCPGEVGRPTEHSLIFDLEPHLALIFCFAAHHHYRNCFFLGRNRVVPDFILVLPKYVAVCRYFLHSRLGHTRWPSLKLKKAGDLDFARVFRAVAPQTDSQVVSPLPYVREFPPKVVAIIADPGNRSNVGSYVSGRC